MTEAATQGQGQSTPESGASEGGQQESGSQRTFTQADLNKIAANEKRDGTKAGKQAAISELLERAREVNPDVESIDDVLAGFSEYQGIQEAVTTEADRLRSDLEKEKARRKDSDSYAESIHREYALRDALRDAGINSERLPLALKVADMDSLEVDRKSRAVSGVEDAVEAINEASPEWFGSGEAQRQRVNAPETRGTGVGGSGAAAGTEEDVRTQMGASLLRHIQDGRSRSSGGNRFS